MAFKLLLLISLSITISSQDGQPAGGGQHEPTISMSREELDKLLQEGLDLTAKGSDVTRPASRIGSLYPYPAQSLHQKLVRDIFHHLNKDRMEEFVKKFSSFPTRSAHYSSDGPNGSAETWLNEEINSVLSNYKGFTIYKVGYTLKPDDSNPLYRQETIIVKLHGQDRPHRNELVILGAHYDSINSAISDAGGGSTVIPAAPGADDNASGCAVVLEVLRLIVETRLRFEHGLEFHFYAAGELELIGSQDVVAQYLNKTAKVRAMLNLDGLGYQSSKYGKTIALNYYGTDPELMEYVKSLTTDYVEEYKTMERDCQFAKVCLSDHISWNISGFPTAAVSEAETSPYIHSLADTIETVNFEQVTEIAKIALAFMIELGDPIIPNSTPATLFMNKPGVIIMIVLAAVGISFDF